MAKKVSGNRGKKTAKKRAIKKKAASKSVSQKTKISAMIQRLIEEGMSQSDISVSLNVSGAIISLLKTQKYSSRLDYHEGALEELLNDRGVDVQSVHHVDGEGSSAFGDWLAQQLEERNIAPSVLARNAGVSALTVGYIIDGTTINPQKGTREKIEKALNASWDGEELGNDVRVITSGVPFSKQEIDQIPEGVGVYAIHDRRGFPTYIGKGRVKNRLKGHIEHRAFIEQRVAYTFSYTLLSSEGTEKDRKKEVDEEAFWIERLMVKFVGNAVLVNDRLTVDLSDGGESDEDY